MKRLLQFLRSLRDPLLILAIIYAGYEFLFHTNLGTPEVVAIKWHNGAFQKLSTIILCG